MKNWDHINAVNRMQVYIKHHMNEHITMYQLAQQAGYSPWYAAKIFKELIGKTPFEYIRLKRLSDAAIKLRDEPRTKVLEIAFDFVFDSHEGFTRAFSKQFGMSPSNYKNNPTPIKLFLPYQVRDYYLTFQKGEMDMDQKKESYTKTVFVQVIDKPARKLILKRGIEAQHYFDYCEEVGEDVWGILTSIKEALNEPMGMWLPSGLRTPGTSIYAQGVEVPTDYNGVIPEGFDLIELEPCKMMIFQGQPYKDEEFGEAIKQLWDVIEDYDPTLYGFKYSEQDAPRFQLEPIGYRGYIEGRPVRPINKD